jgi:hypothetical protein
MTQRSARGRRSAVDLLSEPLRNAVSFDFMQKQTFLFWRDEVDTHEARKTYTNRFSKGKLAYRDKPVQDNRR